MSQLLATQQAVLAGPPIKGEPWRDLPSHLHPPAHLRRLAAYILLEPGRLALLSVLLSRRREALALSDLAWLAGQDQEVTARLAEDLEQHGLLRLIHCGRHTFCQAEWAGQAGLQLRDFWDWREHCLSELSQIRNYLVCEAG